MDRPIPQSWFAADDDDRKEEDQVVRAYDEIKVGDTVRFDHPDQGVDIGDVEWVKRDIYGVIDQIGVQSRVYGEYRRFYILALSEVSIALHKGN